MDERLFFWLSLAIALVLVAGVLYERGRRRALVRQNVQETYVSATLTEVIENTNGGTLCQVILLIVNAVAVIILISGSARSAIQESAIAGMWIALNVVFCAGALMGRRRTFIMRQPYQADEPGDDR